MIVRTRVMILSLTAALLCLTACSAFAAELQLAGIRLGRSATAILQMYGNPSEVRVGASAVQTDPTQGMPMQMGFPGMPGMEMAAPGMMAPPEGGMPGMPGASAPARRTPPEITWIYNFPKNQRLEFIITPDGRVVQIAAFGVDWPLIKTSLGIKLGDSYKDVLLKYGFPERHDKQGLEMTARYTERHRAIFTFIGARTLVGITIGLMD